MRQSVKAREIMRRALILLMSLIITVALSGCGTTGTQTSVGNANQGTSNTGGPTTTNSGGSAGSGPKNQGIGGTSDSSSNTATVNGNTRVNPPGPIGGGSAGNTRP